MQGNVYYAVLWRLQRARQHDRLSADTERGCL